MAASSPHFGTEAVDWRRRLATLIAAGAACVSVTTHAAEATRRWPTASLKVAAAVDEGTAVETVVLAESNEPADNETSGSLPPTSLVQTTPQTPAAEEIAAQEEKSPRILRGFRPISKVTANVALPPGLLPEQAERQEGQPQPEQAREVGDMRFEGGWAESDHQWSATRLCHGPLYFEEINLERHGYQCNPLIQPLVSGAHFFLTVPTLPYQMTVHPPRECIYTLGYYRPGDCVPWRRQCPYPWDPRAAAVEAATAVGLVFLIP